MTKKIILAAMLSMVAAGPGLAQQPAPVKVEQGLVQGTNEDGLTVYRGIPFAAPPVGDLRWRAPQPAAKWDGVRQATNFAPAPIQGCETAVRHERGLSVFECLDAGKIPARPHPRARVDLRRRIQRRRHLRSQLQRRETGPKRRGAGQHRLSSRPARISRASGIERRKPRITFRAITACWTKSPVSNG